MIDWEDRANQPPSGSIQPGETVAGLITALAFELDREGQRTLVWTLDGGRPRWANKGLWRAMAQARLQVGDHVRITRGPDQPSGGVTRSTWTIDRVTAPAPAPFHAAAQAAPQMPAW
jgi:hypothetical protein